MAAVIAAAHGQAPPQPGPMQSGRHVGGDAKPAAAPGAQDPPGAAAGQSFDVNKIFAGSCGWCHARGGRNAGKGPMLMGTALSDAEIISRIRNGKTGQMPAFAFTDEQLRAIVNYIRDLKPDLQAGGAK
jgi:mono/diheme cytochrome c family protein